MIRRLAPLFLLGFLTACGETTTPGPNASPSPTAAPAPPSTLTPVPTPAPALTPKAIPIEVGGFTLLVPPPWQFDLQGDTVDISDPKRTTVISFTRTAYDGEANTLQDIIDGYFDALEERGADLARGEARPIVVGGAKGIAVDVTGTLPDAPIAGRAIAVSPAVASLFFGVGFSDLSEDPGLWETTGSDAFETMIASVAFVDIQSNGSCVVSEDPTYGYGKTNPIRVGGGASDGPARERAYLNNLLGPNGELLSYTREGSAASGETTLNVYRVTGPGVDATLYLDAYNYEPAQAPVGFTCVGEFPLSTP